MEAITRTVSVTITSTDDDDDGANRVASLVTAGPDYPDPKWSHTTLNYYKDADEPPPDTFNSPKLTEHDLRMARRGDDSPHIAPTAVRIRNLRGEEWDCSIERQGFAVAHLDSHMPSSAESWRDDEQLKQVFFPELDALLKRELGCKQTVQYEWHVRTATLENALAEPSEGKVDINGPVRRVHIDESPASAKREFAYHCPELAAKGSKFGIYNVWKPLKTIRRDPLCLCDARTLRDEDLQLGKVTVPKVGEIENFAVRAPRGEGAHGFCYVRGMTVDEAYVFRIYDGRVDDDDDGGGKGKRSHGVAHASFIDPGTEEEGARESVEVRSFCVF